jgi:hypothetical protein
VCWVVCSNKRRQPLLARIAALRFKGGVRSQARQVFPPLLTKPFAPTRAQRAGGTTPVVQASQSCSTPRRKHKPRPPRARMAGREPRAKTRMKRRAANRSRHGLLDRHFIRKMRRILQQGRKLGISEQRLRELTVIAAGRIGKRLQQAMAKELLREPRPARQRPKDSSRWPRYRITLIAKDCP